MGERHRYLDPVHPDRLVAGPSVGLLHAVDRYRERGRGRQPDEDRCCESDDGDPAQVPSPWSRGLDRSLPRNLARPSANVGTSTYGVSVADRTAKATLRGSEGRDGRSTRGGDRYEEIWALLSMMFHAYAGAPC